MIELGQNLHLHVTADGVENEDTTRNLRNLGCDHAQGLHISRPLTAAEYRDYLNGLNGLNGHNGLDGDSLNGDNGLNGHSALAGA
jgi:EAL domain-containing protein (putative c-di-GMP-specific phosphodiesterase class I)